MPKANVSFIAIFLVTILVAHSIALPALAARHDRDPDELWLAKRLLQKARYDLGKRQNANGYDDGEEVLDRNERLMVLPCTKQYCPKGK